MKSNFHFAILRFSDFANEGVNGRQGQIAKSRIREIAKCLVLIGLSSAAFAQTPIRYTVSFPRPQAHFVSVEARIPVEGLAELELMMPVWTPGSYLVREYSRH